MRTSLYLKLIIAFMLVALAAAALVAVLIRLNSADQLAQLILDQQRSSMAQLLANHYANTGSWNNIGESWRQLQGNVSSFPGAQPGTQPGERPGGGGRTKDQVRNLFGLADADGRVIVALDPRYPSGSKAPADVLAAGENIMVDGKKVGTLLVASQLPNYNPEEARFLERTNYALALSVLGALLLALGFGFLLARTLTSPLKELTQAAQKISEGQLEQQVSVKSTDEIGRLAAAFNRMSQEVARSNQLRRQMTADIAHDLRTPLTVIGGYIESMRDGVLTPSTQRLDLIYTEIERLQRLVGDLRMLTQADAGELPLTPQKIAPAELLQRAADLFQHHAERQKVTLEVKTPPALPEIMVDDSRMMQVMDNLLSNALRYTPEGGRITLSARKVKDRVELAVSDTGAGIPIEEVPHIFNRFYRADKSRHSDNGESGLGLAIVKALVESHKGRVWADSAPGLGTTIHIELPVA
jgi:signal transduction histidine kinase